MGRAVGVTHAVNDTEAGLGDDRASTIAVTCCCLTSRVVRLALIRCSTALTVATHVAAGAGTPIVTRAGIVGGAASCFGVTGVIRALVTVITIDQAARAFASATDVARSTLISVVALLDIVRVHTSGAGITGIGGAHISIITLGRRSSSTFTTSTGITHSARIAIGTCGCVVCIGAAGLRCARVIRTLVAIVTVE